MARTLYVNRLGQGYRETVSEIPPAPKPVGTMGASVISTNRREANRECAEYRESDPRGSYYVSSRACSNWKG